MIIGGVLLLFMPLLWLLLPASHSLSESTDGDQVDDHDDQSVSSLQLLKIPSIVLVLLNMSSCYAAFCTFSDILCSVSENEFGWGAAHIGLIFLIAGVVYLVFAVVIGLVVDATSLRIVMIIGLLVETCGMMLIGPSLMFSFLSPKPWYVYIGSTLFGFGMAMVVISAGPDVMRTSISRGYQKNMALHGWSYIRTVVSSYLFVWSTRCSHCWRPDSCIRFSHLYLNFWFCQFSADDCHYRGHCSQHLYV